MRTFDSGATRDTDEGKLAFDEYLSVPAIKAFAEYMRSHQVQADGTVRSGSNWQKGIPVDAYMSSMFRHFFDVWALHRGHTNEAGADDVVEALCALWFNVQGMLHELLKRQALKDAFEQHEDIIQDLSKISGVHPISQGGLRYTINNAPLRGCGCDVYGPCIEHRP